MLGADTDNADPRAASPGPQWALQPPPRRRLNFLTSKDSRHFICPSLPACVPSHTLRGRPALRRKPPFPRSRPAPFNKQARQARQARQTQQAQQAREIPQPQQPQQPQPVRQAPQSPRPNQQPTPSFNEGRGRTDAPPGQKAPEHRPAAGIRPVTRPLRPHAPRPPQGHRPGCRDATSSAAPGGVPAIREPDTQARTGTRAPCLRPGA